MSYKRTTVSLSPEIIALAEKVMAARKFSGFSTFIAQLIREDWERSASTLEEASVPYRISAKKPLKRKRETN